MSEVKPATDGQKTRPEMSKPPTPTQRTKPRVERFRFSSRRIVRKHAPWANMIVRVGSTWVAYESYEQAAETHGGLYPMDRKNNASA